MLSRWLILCAALLIGACAYSSDHWTQPTNPDDGKIPGPPRYVKILCWHRAQLFEAEFEQKGGLLRDYFLLVSPEPTSWELAPGWYAPGHWQGPNPTPAMSVNEEIALEAMQRLWPPGSEIELDYPMLKKRSAIGDSYVRVSRSEVKVSLSWHGAHVVTLKKRVINKIKKSE